MPEPTQVSFLRSGTKRAPESREAAQLGRSFSRQTSITGHWLAIFRELLQAHQQDETIASAPTFASLDEFFWSPHQAVKIVRTGATPTAPLFGDRPDPPATREHPTISSLWFLNNALQH